MDKAKMHSLKVPVAVTFLLMLVVNTLSVVLPINGVTPGEVSDSYPNLFAPAGITFAIWGVIYLALAAYTLYQFGMNRKNQDPAKSVFAARVRSYFVISSIANSAWIFAWHYRFIPVAMALITVMLICLIAVNILTHREDLTAGDRIFVRFPFSIYFGWITVATIANATTLLVSMGWDGLGFSESTWTMVILIVGALIGSLTLLKNRDIAYGLVLVWAYTGILIKHLSAAGFNGQYKLVIATVIACIVIFLLAVFKVLFAGRKILGNARSSEKLK